MSEIRLQTANLVLTVQSDGRLILGSPVWGALCIGPLTAGLTAEGARLRAAERRAEQEEGGLTVTTRFGSPALSLVQKFRTTDGAAVRLESELVNESGRAATLDDVRLLMLAPDGHAKVCLAAEPAAVRLYEQGGYWARVRRLGPPLAQDGGKREDAPEARETRDSQFVWVGYDSALRMALLAGFETGERWMGHITTQSAPGEHPSGWSVGFDGGALRVEPGERLPLEDVLLLCGPDPLALLEDYGDRVAARHGVRILPQPPVTWCSWYPYRLGVTEERLLVNGRIAAERLKPLGLRIMETDLGWERDYLPNAFEENEQFPHGLKGTADQLEALGFVLGAWKAPFTISAHDPMAKEHPDWLLGGEGKKPMPLGEWFWEPHGETYALDLTHPEAQVWLRAKIRSLAARGVRYFKPDFIGGVMNGALRERHDRRIIAGGGCEAARIGMKIIGEEMRAGSPNALVLNCGCPDLPGAGAFPLLYTCNDTGNTGYVGWNHLREDYGRNVAGHLWKNRRWGILQPSCLVVGLPGTLEEARLRATATFLCGGQVDISDDLTTLPEDRWQVLLATLPPSGRSARPVDLFEPVAATSLSYDGMTRGRQTDATALAEEDVSRVWHLPVEADWDRWDLIGLFNYSANENAAYGTAQITRFRLPLARFGLEPGAAYRLYEFWSGQYLGEIPAVRRNPRGYVHPGDTQALISTTEPGLLEVAFFGPSVKLLVVRRARLHPWIVGTSFHQSGGAELSGVAWDGSGALRAVLNRPAGQQGYVVIADAGRGLPSEARVGGEAAPVQSCANGALVLPVLTRGAATEITVRWN
jgi:hypothetical protein